MSVDLTVLICSVHTRYRTFGLAIQDQIWGQYNALSLPDRKRVEIIMLTDAKSMMLGHKRNVMVDIAQGKYVVFVDDDDRLEPDYLASLLEATATDADVLTFLVSVIWNGKPPKICHYSLDYAKDASDGEIYQRLPNHICAVKRELASKVSFPNIIYGEDSGYSKLLRPLLKTEHHIPRVLYHYDYDSETTETQTHHRAALRMRKQPPVADVVIVSHASTPELVQMTQNTIDTCVAGANSLPLHVIVMEQQPGVRYRHAQTVFAGGQEFNYNALLNRGAQMSLAPWIVAANNDLNFYDGWLHQLLAADHPVVSPKNPSDGRQRHITENTTGYTNAEHLSGWCFMISRELWGQIGGFDECVNFWCSDDVVIEQLKAIDVAPMMVPGALVDHHVSATLRDHPEREELTWGQVEIFNSKYGQDKFMQDARYRRWLSAKMEKL